ncbi:hypothetical protein [Chromobacterium sphagni]|nr:hypothetical protein [Chromobacterium sphagni]
MFSITEALPRLTPKLAELSQQALFDDVWLRPGLSRRERSQIAIEPRPR